MIITTKSSFYYGHTVDDLNNTLSFNEGSGELVATLAVGEYTLTNYALVVANAMTTAGTQTYTISIDRSTRILSVSADSVFSLLTTSGSNLGAFTLMGFSGADKTGSAVYVGDGASGSEYIPQFLLQSYVGTEHYKEAVSAAITESGSGEIQIVSYGSKQFMECNITFVTNIDQGTGGPIETNLTGVEDLVTFLNNITGKTKIEFMADRNTPTIYESFLLESTKTDKKGTGFKLKELYGRKLPNYFETGMLKFRKTE